LKALDCEFDAKIEFEEPLCMQSFEIRTIIIVIRFVAERNFFEKLGRAVQKKVRGPKEDFIFLHVAGRCAGDCGPISLHG
jgi:hypothetical protein